MNNGFEINFIYRLLKVFILLLLTSKVFSQPVANFSATPLSGCSPLLVNFADLSTGAPTSWKWDLGNGTISFVQNPSVSYFSSGKYKITLIAGNNIGSDTIIKDSYITVQEPPDVDFSANQTKGCYPLNIQFSDKSSSSGGSIISWQWDFGDGNVNFSKNPQHIYTSSGLYSVTLTIKNIFGCENTFTRPQYIQIHEGVIADFNNDAQASCALPVTLPFENFSAGLGPLSYRWNFGDGTTSTAKHPTHVFNKPGDVLVQLLAITSNGCIDTAESLINIGTVKAEFSAPDSVCRNQPFTFTNSSTPAADQTRWYFGDGQTSNLISPTKAYKNPGTYNVKMVADFGECLDSISKKIIVRPRYRFDFSADTQKNCVAPFTVSFDSDIGDATIYKWDFGDGATSIATNPTHTYNDLKSFDVSLIVMSSAGCLDTLRKRGFIRLKQPVLKILELPAEGCIPFSFTFSAEIDSGLAIQNHLWTFGDGTTSTSANPTHTFSEVGRYTISLSVITSGGCSKKTTIVKGISAGIKPVANFSADLRDVCAGAGINFSDLSTGDVNGWQWKFGDGVTSTAQNPTHIYQDTGMFSVTLLAKSTGCTDEITFENYIHIKPPLAKFSVDYKCAEPTKRFFTDSSVGVDMWFWNFGDGTTSTLQNPPEHIYADTGIYQVSLTVKNLSNGCEFTRTDDIPLITPKAKFITRDTSICQGSEITFYTQDIYDPYILKYEWDFGDGTSGTTTNDTIVHKYPDQGIYNIRLIITDILGCKDTLDRLNYLKVKGPAAFFRTSSAGGCQNKNVLFIDSSESDGTHLLQQWTWDYGDGTVTNYTAPPFEHSYAAPGFYTISLKVLDSNGCVDSVIKENYLEITQPIARFNSLDTASCSSRNVKFKNLSKGRKLTSLWNFGDGTTSVVRNPSHQFLADGVYNISLMVKNEYGCTDSVEKSDYVIITSPKADFVTTDTLSPCSPFLATFTNFSNNYRTLIWNFGDSNLSTVTNPSHVYSYPGTYRVTLKATGPGGCSDEKIATVIVKGPKGVFDYTKPAGCDSIKTIFTASAKNSDSFIWDFNDGTTLSNTDSIVSHTYINPGFYIPKLILISANCQVPLVGQDTIWVYNVTAANKSSNRTICDSGFVSFTDSSYSNDLITDYLWVFGDGKTSTEKNPAHFYTVPGLYKPQLKVTTNSGCNDTTVLASPVKVIASPQLAITGDSGACTAAAITFSGEITVADTSVISWLWNFGNNNTSASQNPTPQIYTSAGFYTILATGTNSSGCSSTVSKTIEAYPIPLVEVMQDSFVCLGNSINLNVMGASAYTWSPSATLSCNNCPDPVATPVSTTTYVAEGVSLFGCKAKDTIEILVKFPFKIALSNNDSLCRGRSVRLNATGAASYLWTPSNSLDDPTKRNPVASPTESTTYTVVGTDNKKCFSDSGNISIAVFALPTVNAGADTTINTGQTADLTPKLSSDVVDVKWIPATSIIANNYPDVTVKPEATTEYTVLVTNSGTCIARDKVTVHVICNNANVFIPNTFSPNGNGTNDIFYPRGSGLFTIRALRIFNRWGALIFQKNNLIPNDPKAGWDGTYKGKLLSPDVFIYQVDIVCSNGSILFYRGNVALIL